MNATAQEEYDITKDKIWQQIKELQTMILAHQKAFDGDNWGMVGDLKELSEQLRQILEVD